MRKGQKLTDEQVDMIRWLVGVNQYELAAYFGVKQPYISEIQSGKHRKHGREKELDWFRHKEARTIASRFRRVVWRKDTGEKAIGRSKKRRKDWATRKTSQDFKKTLALRRANEKWRRSIEKFRQYHKGPDAWYHARINSIKTHCKRRHPLTADNVYVQVYKGKTMRRCKKCELMNHRKRYAKIHKNRKTDRTRRCGIQTQEGVSG